MEFSNLSNKIFKQCISDYHIHDDVNYHIENSYDKGSIENILYNKCWIDTVQWHLEDIIRNPDIDAAEALSLKRRIDKSNQVRTDMVEKLDMYFLEKYKNVKIQDEARINTESPAWAIDRLSILALKIYHWEAETLRQNITMEHLSFCSDKLEILLTQKEDLSTAIDQLLEDIESGAKYMKVYCQMKMYNDPKLNPVLYSKPNKK